jgi:acyl phosphate:glycerol-3-phosphate acyltransferase
LTTWALWLAVGYFAGSIPFGVLVTRWRTGKDVRAHGSGNIGATNVARVAGKALGALVLVLDAAKAAVPVLLSQHFVPGDYWLHVATGAAAFVGHVFPVWLKFQGGKGVASAAGALAVLLPWSAVAGFAVWVSVLLILRISSVGSLLGALVAVGLAFFQPVPRPYAWLSVGLTLAMIFTHRGNIQRLLKGGENKV